MNRMSSGIHYQEILDQNAEDIQNNHSHRNTFDIDSDDSTSSDHHGNTVLDDHVSDRSSYELLEESTQHPTSNHQQLHHYWLNKSNHGDKKVFYTYFKNVLLNLIYPPNLPISLQVWHSNNIAIPTSYFLVGILQGLSAGVMMMFLLEINATEAQQTTILALRMLPTTFKVLFGFISDSFPILGYRRKVYMILGWLISSLSMLSLFLLEYHHSKSVQSSHVSIISISIFYFLFGFGYWFADVIADSVIAEKSKLEELSNRGKLQSTCYACRFFGSLVSMTIATFTYEHIPPYIYFFVMGILPWFTSIPASYMFCEQKVKVYPKLTVLWDDIWSTVCSQAVWRPMAFIFLFATLQVSNSAWNQYLYTVLKFSSVQINSFMIVSFGLLYVGVLIYKAYLRNINYRYIYLSTSSLRAFFSILQILLILQINRAWGISDYLFALGDDVLYEFASGIQYLPHMIMIAQLCPVGSEGTSYAMFTSFLNCANQLSNAISIRLLSIWDVSKDTMSNGNLSGLLNLNILTSAIQLSPLLFLFLLPRGIDELKVLDHYRKSAIGGFVFLSILLITIVYIVTSSILNIVTPGWSGES